MAELSATARDQKMKQAQTLWSAAELVRAFHGNEEVIAYLTNLADEVAPNQGQ